MKHLLYLQLRRSLLEQQIRCLTDQHVSLSGLALQAEFGDYSDQVYQSSNQSHYRPEVPRGFEEVKVPRLRDNGPGWW